MKKEFSKSWKASKQPRKQRKYAANAPLHMKRNLLSANLSKELRKEHNKKNLVLRKGDKVKILRGGHKGKTGKVSNITIKNPGVYVEGIQKQKNDGSKVLVKLQPSNLQITELNLENNKRIKKTEKKEKSGKTSKTKEQSQDEKTPDKKSKESSSNKSKTKKQENKK